MRNKLYFAKLLFGAYYTFTFTFTANSGRVQFKPQSHYSDNQSPTSRSRQPSATISNQFPTKILVLNRSPTVCRPIADCLPTGRRVVDNQLPITRRLIIEHTSHFGTWSATIWRVIADWSPTVWRDVICIIFWITLPSKEIPTFLRPYVDSFMNTCWNFFWNEGDTIDYIVWLSLIWDTDWLNTVTWSTNISVCCPPQSCGGGTLIDTTHFFTQTNGKLSLRYYRFKHVCWPS